MTAEVLKAQPALSALTDEQIGAIVTMSSNDESAVIGNRLGEIYRDLDNRIDETLKIKRNGDEKTRDYLTRATKEFASKYSDYDAIKASVEELKTEKQRLEQMAQNGATDKELKQKYDQISAELASTKQAYTDLQSKFTQADAEHKAAMVGLEVDNVLQNAMSGIKLKGNLPESAVRALTNEAISKVKAMNPDFTTDAMGKRTLVFRDENGGIKNNPANQLNPFTASELLSNEFKALGILDEGRKQTGGGTIPVPSPQGAYVDVSMARSRQEADQILSNTLLKQGFIVNSPDYISKMVELRKENAELYKSLH